MDILYSLPECPESCDMCADSDDNMVAECTYCQDGFGLSGNKVNCVGENLLLVL